MKAIVTTTINPPTEALIRFSKMKDWNLYIVGDQKTPHEAYARMNANYIHPVEQEREYKDLSDLIGWNCIQRRNIGLVQAYRDGAEIVATVDDDNIPYEGWGENLLVGQTVEVDCYENSQGVFDPLSCTNLKHMWHRGYPIQLLSTRMDNKFIGKRLITPMVQADLWDGEPDVDAICRLTNNHPSVKISGEFPYTCTGITIFNSQNTFLHHSVVPYYTVVAGADRMDDIWGGIILQKRFTEPVVVFNRPSVYQKRNPHNIIHDMERELMGHYDTLGLIRNDGHKWKKFYKCYERNCCIVY